nr:hypothetical protein [Tanacetum cinerariifolium]
MKSTSTPVDMEKTLVKDADGDDVDVHLYKSMIGSLIYLTTSRSGIIDSLFEFVAYTDTDYARTSLDMKFTSGGCQFLGSRLISWQCKKQTVVATSTTKAKYMATARNIVTNLRVTPSWREIVCLTFSKAGILLKSLNRSGQAKLSSGFSSTPSGIPLRCDFGGVTMLLTCLFKIVMGESPELFNESYVLYIRVMYPLTALQDQKTQKDYGMKRGRHSTSSSSGFGQQSFSHLNDDDDDDRNDEWTLRASTPSPTRFVNSLTNELRDEHHGGLRSIGKGIKNLLRGKKKK